MPISPVNFRVQGYREREMVPQAVQRLQELCGYSSSMVEIAPLLGFASASALETALAPWKPTIDQWRTEAKSLLSQLAEPSGGPTEYAYDRGPTVERLTEDGDTVAASFTWRVSVNGEESRDFTLFYSRAERDFVAAVSHPPYSRYGESVVWSAKG